MSLSQSGLVIKSIDERIKAVITPYYTCSYSGLAELGKGDTAEWIATELSDHICDPDLGIDTLTANVEKQVNRQKFKGQSLTIVCAGWFSVSGDPIKPMAVVISNLDEQTGRVLNKFSMKGLSRLNGRLSTVIPNGLRLHRPELLAVNQNVENLCKNKRTTARSIAHVLAECVKLVARSSDRKAYVSEEVLVMCLPRYDRLKGLLVVGMLVEDYWSAICIRAGKSRVEQPGGPFIVGNKGVIQALIPLNRPPRNGIVSTESKIIRMPERGSISNYLLTDPPVGQAWGWPGMEDELKGQSLC